MSERQLPTRCSFAWMALRSVGKVHMTRMRLFWAKVKIGCSYQYQDFGNRGCIMSSLLRVYNVLALKQEKLTLLVHCRDTESLTPIKFYVQTCLFWGWIGQKTFLFSTVEGYSTYFYAYVERCKFCYNMQDVSD